MANTKANAKAKKEPATKAGLTLVEVVETSTERQDAEALHYRLVASGRAVAAAMVDFMQQLKQMRDSKLYTALGYATFDEYIEQMVGLKSRQAYYYISTYEALGPDLVQHNADLGITKLRLLAAVNPLDREQFVEENDLESKSVKEMRKLVEENNGLKEQLSLLETQRDEAKEAAEKAGQEEVTKALEEAEKAQAARDEALKQVGKLEQEQEQAIKTAVAEATKKAEAEAKRKAEEAAAKKIEKVKTETEQRYMKQAEAEQAALRAQRAEAEERAAKLQKDLEIQSSVESTAFSLHFGMFAQSYASMMEQAAAMEAKGQAEDAAKYKKAVQKQLGKWQAELQPAE